MTKNRRWPFRLTALAVAVVSTSVLMTGCTIAQHSSGSHHGGSQHAGSHSPGTSSSGPVASTSSSSDSPSPSVPMTKRIRVSGAGGQVTVSMDVPRSLKRGTGVEPASYGTWLCSTSDCAAGHGVQVVITAHDLRRNDAGYIRHVDFTLPPGRANDRLARFWIHANPAYRRLPDFTPDDGSVHFIHLVQKNAMEWTHHFVAIQSHCQIDVMWTFALTDYSSRAVQNGIMIPAMKSLTAQ